MATQIAKVPYSVWGFCSLCSKRALDIYMLKDDVWRELQIPDNGYKHYLACLECADLRAILMRGRYLEVSDFKENCKANNAIFWAWRRGRESRTVRDV